MQRGMPNFKLRISSWFVQLLVLNLFMSWSLFQNKYVNYSLFDMHCKKIIVIERLLFTVKVQDH